MALFLFLRFHLILLTFGFYMKTRPFRPVKAVANVETTGPLINITIPPPPTLLIQQNSSVSLPCTVSINNTIVKDKSEESLDFIWYKNNEKLTTGRKGNEYYLYENGSLRLPSNENVNGIYHCLVNATQKGLGSIISPKSVITYAVLKRLHIDLNVKAKIGMHVRLDCPVKSIPPANITWKFKNYTTQSLRSTNRIFQLENGSLIINSIKENDKGKYKCVAENQFTLKQSRQFLWSISLEDTNDGKLTNSIHPGSLLPPLQDNILYVPSGNKLKLRCMTYSDNIEWWFSRKRSIMPIKINNHSNEIYLNNVSVEKHNGSYTCSTGNDSQVFEVIVTEPPTIEQPLRSIESSLAATASLSCKAFGNPQPEIIWYRNGIQLNNSYTIRYIPPYLKIYSFDLMDEGIYQCFARNVAGEAVTVGQIKLRNKKDIANMPKRPENIKCYPVNYKTLNVTFNSRSALFMMNIHIVTENPFKWNSTMPVKVQSNSYVLVSKGLPVLKPFILFLRGLVATSTIQTSSGIDQTFDPSLLSYGTKCATQGLVVNGIFFPNGIYVWWSQLNFLKAKYFIIQIKNKELDNAIFNDIAIGTTKPIDIYDSKNDVEKLLQKIPIINGKYYSEYSNSSDSNKYKNNNNNSNDNIISLLETSMEQGGAINNSEPSLLTSLVVPGNVTGILIPNITNVTIRVLVITEENEHLKQDFRYLEWKTIENSTTNSFVFRVTDIESRNINFAWNSVGGISCIKVCYNSLNIDAIIRDDQQKFCEQINDDSPNFSVRKLKPLTTYRMDFLDCNLMHHLGSTEVQTKADLPGPISNQRITKNGGLKLMWDSPINPNGKILYYVVHWTSKNHTYEANVTQNDRFFIFPNVTENDKINVTVRVVGLSGIGPPIYIDLGSLETIFLENESTSEFDYTLGVVIGVFLSIICIVVFVCIFIRQRSKFKRQRQTNSNRTSPSEQNFSTPTPASMELHEMQTLIPQQTANIEVINSSIVPLRVVPNGNGVFHRMKLPVSTLNDELYKSRERCESPNIFSSTPFVERRKKDLSEILLEENAPKYYPHSIDDNNDDEYDDGGDAGIFVSGDFQHDFNNFSSSSAFLNNSKTNLNGNPTYCQNGSIKTLLPPIKHSITVVETEPATKNSNDCLNTSKPSAKHTIHPNSNISSFENSQQHLLNSFDNSNQEKNERLCCKDQNDTSNTTTTTFVSMDDSDQDCLTSLQKPNWNYHRPVVDPNG